MSNLKVNKTYKTIAVKFFNLRFKLSFFAADWNPFSCLNWQAYTGESISHKGQKFLSIHVLGFGFSFYWKIKNI